MEDISFFLSLRSCLCSHSILTIFARQVATTNERKGIFSQSCPQQTRYLKFRLDTILSCPGQCFDRFYTKSTTNRTSVSKLRH